MEDIKARLTALLDELFADEDYADCFLVDMKIAPTRKKIEIYADCDDGIDFDTCKEISRYLEEHLDEHGWMGEDYTLEVSSPGATRPFKFARQYPRNVGRTLSVTLTDNRLIEGVLTDVKPDESITLNYETKHKEGKKTIKTQHNDVIAFADIKEAVVVLKF